MRLLLPSFLAVVLLLSACKYDSDVEEIPEFENTFSLNGNQEANRLIAVSDGIIGVGTSDVGGVKRLLLLKTDFSGNLLWQKELESGTEGFGIKLTADKYLILAGTITDENDNRDLLLTKTDQLGNVLWSKHFGGILADQGKDVIELEGGGFMAIGLAQSFGAGPVSMYVVKTDVNGNEIWSRTFGGEGVDGGSELLQVNSFEVLLLGFTGSFGAGDRDIYVQSVSIDGDSLASFTYGGAGYEESQAIQRSSDGGYVMSNHSASNEPNHSLLATKLDANGMVVWEKEFGSAQAHEGGEGVLADREGNYVFLGRTNSFGNDEQVYFIKTDVSGTVLAELNFGQEGDQRGNDIIEHDGAYYMVGTSSIGGDSDVLLIKRPM
ncbi:MAG: hypothetical protein K9J17_09015 [Flavobacteriales bacterium]|nr:hypothetical protein [Flavobacteriales bacterium]